MLNLTLSAYEKLSYLLKRPKRVGKTVLINTKLMAFQKVTALRDFKQENTNDVLVTSWDVYMLGFCSCSERVFQSLLHVT